MLFSGQQNLISDPGTQALPSGGHADFVIKNLVDLFMKNVVFMMNA